MTGAHVSPRPCRGPRQCASSSRWRYSGTVARWDENTMAPLRRAAWAAVGATPQKRGGRIVSELGSPDWSGCLTPNGGYAPSDERCSERRAPVRLALASGTRALDREPGGARRLAASAVPSPVCSANYRKPGPLQMKPWPGKGVQRSSVFFGAGRTSSCSSS
jgi:hypothetical protein